MCLYSNKSLSCPCGCNLCLTLYNEFCACGSWCSPHRLTMLLSDHNCLSIDQHFSRHKKTRTSMPRFYWYTINKHIYDLVLLNPEFAGKLFLHFENALNPTIYAAFRAFFTQSPTKLRLKFYHIREFSTIIFSISTGFLSRILHIFLLEPLHQMDILSLYQLQNYRLLQYSCPDQPPNTL